MSNPRHLCSTLLGALLLFSAWSSDAQTPVTPPKPPIEAFFGDAQVGEVSLSRSGRHLAVTVPGPEGRLRLGVIDLDAPKMEVRLLVGFRDSDVGGLAWVNDGRLLYSAAISSSRESERVAPQGLWAIDVDGNNGRQLIDRATSLESDTTLRYRPLLAFWQLHRTLDDDGDDIVLRQDTGSEKLRDSKLARLNTRTGVLTSISVGAPSGVELWITDNSGVPRVVETVAEGGRRKAWLSSEGSWKQLGEYEGFGGGAWVPRYWLDGKLYVSQRVGPKRYSVLTTLDLTTSKPAEPPLVAAEGFDVGGATAVYDRQARTVIGWRYYTDAAGVTWTHPRMREAQQRIDQLMAGRVNNIVCATCLEGKRWIVASGSDRVPMEYYLYDPATHKASLLLRSRPTIDPRAMGLRDFHRIKARDGMDLPLYITQPAGKAQGPRPAVLLVHGGPWVRDHWGWEPESQFLASRGYVVIETQYRGSSGFGSVHERAGDKQWGLAMQDDLEDGLQWAIDKGYVDGNRVCIMGASYGGYAALMGPVRHPKRFRCVVSYVGVTDLILMQQDKNSDVSDEGKRFGYGRWIGDPVADEKKLRETSPVHRATDLKVPVLGIWGRDDARVPVEHGRKFRDAAKGAGVDLDYHEYLEEGHGWFKQSVRYDFYRRVEKFLEKSLGPQH
jgi:dipeptidyl aminopeptidase/acylaminoacyl peptidase